MDNLLGTEIIITCLAVIMMRYQRVKQPTVTGGALIALTANIAIIVSIAMIALALITSVIVSIYAIG